MNWALTDGNPHGYDDGGSLTPFGVLVTLAIAACFIWGAILLKGEPFDPNEQCVNHGAVQSVKQTGFSINGVLCRDGHFVPNHS